MLGYFGEVFCFGELFTGLCGRTDRVEDGKTRGSRGLEGIEMKERCVEETGLFMIMTMKESKRWQGRKPKSG